ncbi:MAG: SPFH domain-containing protein [bacterium]
MGIFDRLFAEFIDVIEWLDDSNDTMIYRFERHNNEIKYGAKLTVRESQLAVFINEGQVADVLTPGIYELETKNLPILSTLQHWHHGFESPFKAEVYFINTKRFVDLKWGTKNPVMVRDQEFAMVRLRAFGTYSIRITDPVKFIQEIAGTDGHFTTDEISNQLRNLIISRFTNLVGKSNIPILDLAANYDQLGEYVTQRIHPEFAEYGLELIRVLVENISLPEHVAEALDKRSSMGVLGSLDDYLKYQSAEALGKSEGNSALDMGLGIAVAQQMATQLQPNQQQAPAQIQTQTTPATQSTPPSNSTPVPPPLPNSTPWHVALNGQASGPFTTQQLADLVQQGQLDKSTLVWQEGMANWAAAEECSALDPLFANVPPPLPTP